MALTRIEAISYRRDGVPETEAGEPTTLALMGGITVTMMLGLVGLTLAPGADRPRTRPGNSFTRRSSKWFRDVFDQDGSEAPDGAAREILVRGVNGVLDDVRGDAGERIHQPL